MNTYEVEIIIEYAFAPGCVKNYRVPHGTLSSILSETARTHYGPGYQIPSELTIKVRPAED